MALGSDNPKKDEVYQPCERRFRTSDYFLKDQLRCSEALDDFRTVRNLIEHTAEFQPRTALQFQTVVVQTSEV